MIYFAANLPRFSVLTQGTVRRAIPIRGEQPTLDAVRRSVKTASAEVVNMHLQWYHELVRTRKAHKAVLMWKHRSLSKAWGAWYEHHIQIAMEKEGNAEVERLRKMMARMAMKKWMNASLSRAWNKWRYELRRTRLGKRVAKRWTHRVLSKAWVAWESMVAEKKRLRAVAQKVVARWKHRIIAQAWQSWYEDHLQKKRLRHLTSRALSKWKVSFVYTAYCG